MTNLLSLSPKPIDYSSVCWEDSKTMSGVRFAVKRVSLGRRIDLLEKIRSISLRQEFLEAGNEAEQLEAAINNQLTTKLVLKWGLAAVEGLFVDGAMVSTETLIDSGPEDLSLEIVSAIQVQLGLSDDERKNF